MRAVREIRSLRVTGNGGRAAVAEAEECSLPETRTHCIWKAKLFSLPFID